MKEESFQFVLTVYRWNMKHTLLSTNQWISWMNNQEGGFPQHAYFHADSYNEWIGTQ